MGYYINSTSKGETLPPLGKALALKKAGDILEYIGMAPPFEFRENLVCIVYNGDFEGAGYIHNEREFKRFAHSPGDNRPKLWLIVKNAAKLAGYTGE